MIIEGQYNGKGLKIGIIASRFNEFISARLIEGSIDALTRHGVNRDDIDIVRVPGAYEIPAVANRLLKINKYDGILCLGTIIRGETPHFEYVANESAKGIAQISLNSNIPIIYGIITADTVEQAIDRAGTKMGNKGFLSALDLLEMIDLYKQV